MLSLFNGVNGSCLSLDFLNIYARKALESFEILIEHQ